MKIFKIWIYILWIVLIYCSTSSIRNQSINSENKYIETASTKYGKRYVTLYNADTTAIICQKTSKPTNLSRPLHFFIYDLKTNTIVFEDKQPDGKVKWIDNSRIEVRVHPGMVKKGENQRNQIGYIYHIPTGNKKPIYDKNVWIQ